MSVRYPYVECGRPGHPLEPGYAVCTHVIDGAEAAVVEKATSEDIGLIRCAASGCTIPDDFVLICATCARGHGWIREDVES